MCHQTPCILSASSVVCLSSPISPHNKCWSMPIEDLEMLSRWMEIKYRRSYIYTSHIYTYILWITSTVGFWPLMGDPFSGRQSSVCDDCHAICCAAYIQGGSSVFFLNDFERMNSHNKIFQGARRTIRCDLNRGGRGKKTI